MFAKTGVEQKVEIGEIERGQPSRRKYIYIHSFIHSRIEASSHISYVALTFGFSASTSVSGAGEGTQASVHAGQAF